MIPAIVLLIGLLVTTIGWLWRSRTKLEEKNRIISSQQSEIEQQLLDLNTKSDEVGRLIHQNQQIVSVVSHDLKGPFNRIFALVQLLNLTSQNLTAEQREYLDKIHQIVADGLGMMRNLLDNRKLEEKGIELSHEKVNLSALLGSLVKNYEVLASKKNVSIQFNCKPNIWIQSDKGYLTRIFENLLSNALKFSESEKSIQVRAEEGENGVEVAVADEGPGISAEDQAKMYHKFQRLSARPTSGESSTGLGLWITKTVLDKMGGEIDCQSEVGSGTTFTVRLKKGEL